MMYNELKRIGINISPEKKELFSRFADLFKDYNSKVNLMGRNDVNLIFEKHIYDSLAFNLFYTKYVSKNSINIMDMGTGGGFPAIPLAIYYDNCQITAVDSINKKTKFVNYAAKELCINNIKAVCSRVEKLSDNYSFDIIVSRAMANLPIILEYAMPYLKQEGFLIAYKSKKAAEEIGNSQKKLKILNSKIIDKIEYSLPLKEENKRVLLIIKKEF
ncbi:MAG: 16S rRNA (guanine(527)-N(7))-methyltransferase RsmG [Candidatus Gastranaerophilales bacterium]|nr:16S rRNA (guanine(527)-N(7))-methyltransferase RsmG [Candidatus Gastranaerophilales bacterium]